MKETTPTPEYLQHCAYKDCPEPGTIYRDKLVPICLCNKHAAKRHGKIARSAR